MSFEIIVPGRFLDIEPAPGLPSVEGWFTLRAIKDGNVLRERTFKNLITDIGMDALGGYAGNAFRYVQVGLGTTPPTEADTNLANYLASFAASAAGHTYGNSGTPGTSDFFAWTRVTATSAIGALGNNNLTEIGVSSTAATGNLFSRALIVDGMGVPTVFPIADDEQLQSVYEIRLYPPVEDGLATVTVGASSFDTTTRPYRVNSTGSWSIESYSSSYLSFGSSNYSNAHQITTSALTSVTGTLSSSSNSTGYANSGYTGGSYYRNGTAVFGTSVVGSAFKTLVYQTGATQWQVGYSPDLAKTDIQELRLNQRVSWARH